MLNVRLHPVKYHKINDQIWTVVFTFQWHKMLSRRVSCSSSASVDFSGVADNSCFQCHKCCNAICVNGAVGGPGHWATSTWWLEDLTKAESFFDWQQFWNMQQKHWGISEFSRIGQFCKWSWETNCSWFLGICLVMHPIVIVYIIHYEYNTVVSSLFQFNIIILSPCSSLI